MDVGQILNGGPEAKWYTVPGSEAQVQIAKLTPGKRREILKVAGRHRFLSGQRVEWTDWEQANDLFLEASVLAWRGIECEGSEYPCTPENKRALDANWSEFNALWDAIAGASGARDRAREEAERGNS